ncbi:MAG: 3-deoxy-7-phosphoheptulonate synthase [Bdellovibrionales bacterium]|nr:3-deoxy-7-phosphoheptulonate synthase [Bdellovibrionales bacterium]
MSADKIFNVNIVSEELLPTPEEICSAIPRSDKASETVVDGRTTIERILNREDPRLLVVVGPCSIHDIEAARDYATRLRRLSDEVSDTMFLVMRVYFEKPRTTIGWKGLINDPHLDDSFKIDEGLRMARELLLELAEMGLPTGTEVLDPITPQYLIDLVSWSAIGARTTESQKHREISSGLSTAIGFKNGTDGSISVAINALKSVSHQHRFLGVTQDGRCAVFHTKGNKLGHVVLRGGDRPNYDSVNIALCEEKLREATLPVNIVVDCSHGNSLKDHSLQPLVMENCCNQIVNGNRSIVGFMLESNINEGRQDVTNGPKGLSYGVSITDSCMSWDTTEQLLLSSSEKLREILPKRLQD